MIQGCPWLWEVFPEDLTPYHRVNDPGLSLAVGVFNEDLTP